jgi:sterol desaturase/sphingolipid hydroxylase (fatty acid hydroxylase superfamily)
LLILKQLGFYWLAFFGIISIRYFLIAGGTYWVFYSVVRTDRVKRSLRRHPPSGEAMRRDAGLSIASAVFFAFCAALIMSAYDRGLTRLYASGGQYGLWYAGFSFVAILILQDGYFYLIHRAFHHPFLFKLSHHGHHRSGEPTPWTSFAFDLPEAILQGLFFVAIVFVIPLHFLTLIALLLTMTIWAVVTHLGFDPFPRWFFRHGLGRWLIGPTHHAIHHRKYRVHYGLYFTFWDKLLGTEDPTYEQEFQDPI